MSRYIGMKEAFELVKPLGISKGKVTWLIKTDKIPDCFFKKEEEKTRGDFIINENSFKKYFNLSA